VLISLSEKESLAQHAIEVGKAFKSLGFEILATEGTAAFYRSAGVDCEVISKLNEGRPNVLDVILNKHVSLVINTPTGRRDALADDAVIRKAAIKYRVPYITTLAAALAAGKGIKAACNGNGGVKSLQEYHKAIIEV
jgi:carbamoyl-phosphate synthase large subunit